MNQAGDTDSVGDCNISEVMFVPDITKVNSVFDLDDDYLTIAANWSWKIKLGYWAEASFT